MLESRAMLAATITVDSLADGTVVGKTTLRMAIAQANTDLGGGDTIVFSSSLFSGAPATLTLTGGEFQLKQDMTITGPGSGKLTIDANNASRIFNVSDGTAAVINVSISSLKMVNGKITSGTGSGGAVYNAEKLTTNNLVYSNNTVALTNCFGGAVFCASGSTLNSTSDNYSTNSAGNGTAAIDGWGGAIAVDVSATATVTSGTFTSNTALPRTGTGGSGTGGGAIYNKGSLTLSQNNFASNSAQQGGAILNTNVLNSSQDKYSSNVATSSSGLGGAIANSSSTIISQDTFSGNNTPGIGGAIWNSNSVSSSNSSYNGNTSTSNAAAIANVGGTFRSNSDTFNANNTTGSGGAVGNSATFIALNDTFFGNRAGTTGGAIQSSTIATTNLIHSTLTMNSATTNGGAVFTDGSINAVNSILAANTSPGTDVDLHGTIANGANNLIGIPNGDLASDIFVVDALLNPLLRNNGGFTLTVGLDYQGLKLAKSNAGNLTSTANTITAGSGSVSVLSPMFTPVGSVLKIDNEFVLVTGIVGNTLFLSRAFGGTTAASHTLGSGVSLAYDQTGFPRYTLDQGSVAFNSPPTDISLSNSQVADTSTIGTVVGTLSTSDNDTNNTFSYTLGTGGDNTSFKISGNNVVTNNLFDATVKNSYTIQVTSTDQGQLTVIKNITITILPVKNHTPVVPATTFLLLENSPNSSPVGTVVATDVDVGQTLTYAITGGNTNNAFVINSSTGAITVNNSAALNFETIPTFSLTVTATDNGSPILTGSGTITIKLLNVNETPTNISLSNNSINDVQPIGTTVGLLTTTDPDVGGSFTYTLGTSADDLAFTIDASGNLKTAALFNATIQNSYNITVTSTDAGGLFVTKNFTINIPHVNLPPVLANPAILNYLIGMPATPISPQMTVADRDNSTLPSATVTITNYLASDDRLVFSSNGATMGNITGSFNTVTGVLSLSSPGNTANLTQWGAALQAVSYQNISATPNLSPRPIAYQITDGLNASLIYAGKIGLGSSPVLANSTIVAYQKGQSSAMVVNNSITVTDVDHPILAGATVKVANYFAKDDLLGFTNTSSTTFGNIAASFNTSTGTLALVSQNNTATLAQWQAALRAVTYFNRSGFNANVASRSIAYQVTDGTLVSNVITSKLVMAAPVLGNSTVLQYAKGQAASPVTPGLSLTDAGNSTLVSATIKITNYYSPDDLLGFTNNSSTLYGNISGGFNTTTGIMVLTSAGGTATVNQFQAALRSITYFNKSGANANVGARIVTYQVSDGLFSSNVITSLVGIGSTPTLANPDTGNYKRTSAPTAVSSSLTLTDPDHPTLSYAKVSISNYISTEDVLAFTNNNSSLYGNITSSFNATTGILTLYSTGNTATVAQFQAALRAVTYFNSKGSTATTSARLVTFQVSDGVLVGNTVTTTLAIT